MSYRINGRIMKLEQRLAPPDTRRMWQICMDDGESEETAIARHGIDPGPQDMVVIFRYGHCLSCEERGKA